MRRHSERDLRLAPEGGGSELDRGALRVNVWVRTANKQPRFAEKPLAAPYVTAHRSGEWKKTQFVLAEEKRFTSWTPANARIERLTERGGAAPALYVFALARRDPLIPKTTVRTHARTRKSDDGMPVRPSPLSLHWRSRTAGGHHSYSLSACLGTKRHESLLAGRSHRAVQFAGRASMCR
ncbi:hypothetical protein MRX96_043806 [Rhipicephalus microplus]